MIVDLNPPLTPPPTAAPPENSASPKLTSQLNGGDGVDLISDATSWPSLSESTRSPAKSSPPPAIDPPVAALQAPAVSDSSAIHGQPNTNSAPNPNPTPSFTPNANRQKFSGRGGSGRGGPSRGGYIRQAPPPQQFPPAPPLPPPFYGAFEGPMRGPLMGPYFYGNGFGAQPLPADHQFPQHNPSHRGRHHNRPSRPHPRDVRFPQPGPPLNYPMPPQQLVPFPFIAPMLPPEPFMGRPQYTGGHGPVPPPSLSPPPAAYLETKLLNQINYYFSNENLVKDMYLRSQMDEGGWVPVALIANFNKVRELTQDIHLILESLGTSAVVEVQGHKIRRRNDWRRWITTTSATEEATTGLSTNIRAVAV